MDAIELIKERQRMCYSFKNTCKGCPLSGKLCGSFNGLDAEKFVALVEEWSAVHPRKTRQSVFLEQYPNAKLDSEGIICICPELVYGETACAKNCNMLCHDCRHKFWPQEVKE